MWPKLLPILICDGRLVLYDAMYEMEDPLGHVRTLVLAAYRLSTFTTSRFLSLGRSCQGMAMAFMVGLDNHMAFTRALPSTGSYYTHCYDLLDASARRFICKTAVVAICTDQLHELLLKDDRVGKQPQKYVEALRSRLLFVDTSVPLLLYRRLAEHVPEMDASMLEHDVLRSSYHAASYIDRRVFNVARKPVFQTCAGNVREQCAALRQPDAATSEDPILAKVQALLRIGYPMVSIERAFELLAEAPWSILRWEQMHGSGAKQHQLHKGVTAATHSCKTGLSIMLPMARAASCASHICQWSFSELATPALGLIVSSPSLCWSGRVADSTC